MQKITISETKYENNKIDYDKIVNDFGICPIDNDLLEKFEKITGHAPHYMLKRGIFFAHRDLEKILDGYAENKKILIYTGRGPNSDVLHLGHLIPFKMTAWLQKVFNAYVVIQMADDEKFFFKDKPFDDVYKLGFENAKDIMACGFDADKTFIFSNRDIISHEKPKKIIHELFSKARIKDISSIFGLGATDSIGKYVWTIYQAAASCAEYYPFIENPEEYLTLVTYAVDQDPYFRFVRDIVKQKPCSIISTFLPALNSTQKMSSTSDTTTTPTTIFMNSSENFIKKAIMRYTLSGGGATIQEHRLYGANLDIDVPFQYLNFFLEDDQQLEKIRQEYKSGVMLTGEIKNILVDVLINIINNHKNNRNNITDDDLKYLYSMDKFTQHNS